MVICPSSCLEHAVEQPEQPLDDLSCGSTCGVLRRVQPSCELGVVELALRQVVLGEDLLQMVSSLAA